MPDYKSILNMYDAGLQFMNRELGCLPEVGVSIDSFGHSSITHYLLDALGYDAYILFRMPYWMMMETN